MTHDIPTSLPWYALHVRTRAEPTVRQMLQGKGYETFLPTVTEARHYADRVRSVEVAMFPGYLFCRIDTQYRLPVLTIPGVDAIVGAGRTPEPIPEIDISSLMALVSSGIASLPWPYLRRGDRVSVAFGSFAGAEGILVREKGTDRLIVSIDLLQRSVAFEIDRTWVRPATRRLHDAAPVNVLPRVSAQVA